MNVNLTDCMLYYFFLISSFNNEHLAKRKLQSTRTYISNVFPITFIENTFEATLNKTSVY